jgi:dihydrofolate synthase/folylpolyglutamate synthase
LRYNERITIAEQEVADASLVAAFERIDRARGGDTLTFFEFNALAALLVFETACLDAIVLEVGLGGRLDAVNAVDCDVALVTSIALDHCDWLGNDLDSIAREKAGIFRRARPAVFGSRQMPQSIAAVAGETGAQLLKLGDDFDYERGDQHWSWSANRQLGSRRIQNLPLPALVGDVQFDNAAAVLAVLTTLQTRLPINDAAIREGLATVTLRGRFQRLRVSGVQWILDVAHNPAAARTLASQLAATPASGTAHAGADPGRTIAICGILGDKDIAGIAAELRAQIDAWLVVDLPGPRAVPALQLAERLQQTNAQVVASEASVAAACTRAQAMAGPHDRIIVFGSFLTVASALEWLAAKSSL